MRIVKTKNGTYTVDYAWAPLMNGSCGISLRDQRRLPEIASEFDGLSRIEFLDTETMITPVLFEGYTKLWSIANNDGIVTMHLSKENTDVD